MALLVMTYLALAHLGMAYILLADPATAHIVMAFEPGGFMAPDGATGGPPNGHNYIGHLHRQQLHRP